MGLKAISVFLLAGFCGLAQARVEPKTSCEALLSKRYKIDQRRLEFTPNAKIPVIFRMQDQESLAPKIPQNANPVRLMKERDVVIVGGGPAGLTAALYLAQAGKSVLILDRNEQMGGLGMGSELRGIRAGGGAAYSVGPDDELEREIFNKIGLGDFEKKIAIEEPIDSYLWNGRLYKGIWEDHTLDQLPASFALFKHALHRLNGKGAADHEGLGVWTDKMTMAQLVRQMPALVARWKDDKSKELMRRFAADLRLPAGDPMKNVLDLLDLYGRSALGGTTQDISARQFMDFYESEMETRYTGTLGTGTVSEAVIEQLRKYPKLVEMRTLAPVAAMENRDDGVLTSFWEDGVLKQVKSKDAIFSASVALAPKIIKDLKRMDPEKAEVISRMKMTDYAVHVVRIKGHPYRATYDTWVYSDGDLSKPTDYILGRWQDSKIRAYEGMRDFEKDPADDYGVITIYQPLGEADAAHFDRARSLKMVESAVQDMIAKLDPLTAKDGHKIEVELVESFRWPQSIHIVGPGSLQRFEILERPVGRIRFANNTVGAPELEPAMAQAAREAMRLIQAPEKSGDEISIIGR